MFKFCSACRLKFHITFSHKKGLSLDSIGKGLNYFVSCFSVSPISKPVRLSCKINTMDSPQTHKRHRRSNSEQLEVNAKLFAVIRKRKISIKQKVKKVKKFRGKILTLVSMHKAVMITVTLLCTWRLRERVGGA